MNCGKHKNSIFLLQFPFHRVNYRKRMGQMSRMNFSIKTDIGSENSSIRFMQMRRYGVFFPSKLQRLIKSIKIYSRREAQFNYICKSICRWTSKNVSMHDACHIFIDMLTVRIERNCEAILFGWWFCFFFLLCL